MVSPGLYRNLFFLPRKCISGRSHCLGIRATSKYFEPVLVIKLGRVMTSQENVPSALNETRSSKTEVPVEP